MYSLSPSYKRLTNYFVLFVAAGAFLYLAAIFWLGYPEIVNILAEQRAQTLVIGVALGSTAYLWRFCRWEYSIKYLGYNIPYFRHLGIYLSGLALMATPGRVGETIRSVLLLRQGVRWSHSLVAFLVDRSTDVLGICLLGGLAAVMLEYPVAWVWMFVFLGLLLGSCGITYLLSQWRTGALWCWLTRKLHWMPINEGEAVLDAWVNLWKFQRILAFSVVAMFAYGTQALIFAWFCYLADTVVSFADCVLIFVHATLFGAASMLPGGLGVTEGVLMLELINRGVNNVTALSLAISIRFVTLWFGLLLGAISLLVNKSKF